MVRTDRKQNIEERAGNVNFPIKSTFLKWLIPSESKLTLAEHLKVRKWVISKKDTKYIFNLLELDRGVDKVLYNPNIRLYVSYIDRFKKKNPAKEVELIDMFIKTYGNYDVARMVEVGMNSPRTKTFSKRMRLELLNNWLANERTAHDIFSLLKIDTAGYSLFKAPKMNKESNPTLNIFARYIDQLNMLPRSRKVKLIDLFSEKYDDKAIAKMVEIGVMVPSTNAVSSKLLRELLSKWNRHKKSADDVLKVLNLDKAGDELFASPGLITLFLYTKKTTELDNPTNDLLQVLTKHYGYDGLSKIFVMGQHRTDLAVLAKDLETTMGSQWLKSKLSPDEVFKLLKLNDDVDTLLTNPIFLKTWESYRILFNLKNGGKTSTMETLTTFYTKTELSSMLKAAKEVPATKNLAIKLLNELN
ncbi:RxLR effector protein [Phytophthora megakarya]|uniref:RxLR effector protein n=1 Tax=Phytophthora megakarya TaxID=4795 RepID=A0A225WGB1_9STRA|nr:RxLR effector protein [Phytophthora megakarya]